MYSCTNVEQSVYSPTYSGLHYITITVYKQNFVLVGQLTFKPVHFAAVTTCYPPFNTGQMKGS